MTGKSFNDDVFITSKVEPEDFFKNGLPCDMAVEDPISPNKQDVFMHILLNNMTLFYELISLINAKLIQLYYNLKRCLKWLKIGKYGALKQ